MVRVIRDVVTISADSSGVLLHRRGYRLAGAEGTAPRNAGGRGVVGSGLSRRHADGRPLLRVGTLPIEAALISRAIAPGLGASSPSSGGRASTRRRGTSSGRTPRRACGPGRERRSSAAIGMPVQSRPQEAMRSGPGSAGTSSSRKRRFRASYRQSDPDSSPRTPPTGSGSAVRETCATSFPGSGPWFGSAGKAGPSR